MTVRQLTVPKAQAYTNDCQTILDRVGFLSHALFLLLLYLLHFAL